MAKKKPIRVPVAYTTYRLYPRADIRPLGLTKFDGQKILINKRITDKGPWSTTFWHEWLHAVAHEGGYEKISDNEAFVEYMAQAIMKMFTDHVGRAILENMLKHLEPK